MENMHLELAVINDEHPSGTDVRYEPEFDQLQMEIDKLSLPSATTKVDWVKVRQLSSLILKTKSKDLLVAGYFAIAEIRINNLEGLKTGLNVFTGLIENYWDSLYPAKKRMRGRIAAVTWLLEKCEAAVRDIQLEPAGADFIIALHADVQRMATLLEEHLEEPPLLRPLFRIIEEIPIKEGDATRKISPVDFQIVEKTSGDEEIAAEQIQSPQPKVEPIAPAPTAPSGDSFSATEMEKILRGAFQTVRQAADFYFDKDMANPRGYRYRRIAGWAMIQSMPPATGDLTQVPPPGEFADVRKRLLELRSLEKWQELLRLSEKKLPGSLLWLDLNRLSAESLLGLGSQYQDAHDTVCQETAHLLTRLFGLEKLSFTDGSPFGDADTRQWIESILPGSDSALHTPVQQMSQSSDYMDSVLVQAQSLATSKKITQAVHLLNKEMQHSPSGREQLLWQLHLVHLLVNFRHAKLALSQMDDIVRKTEQFNLETWDPALATHALQIVWKGYKIAKTAQEKTDNILSRIAKLDPVAAMQLDK